MLVPNPNLTWGMLKDIHRQAIQDNRMGTDDLLQDDNLAAQADTMPDDAPFFSEDEINAYWGEGGYPDDLFLTLPDEDWEYDFAVNDSGEIIYLLRIADTMERRTGGQWVEITAGDPILDEIDDLSLVETDESSTGDFDTEIENKHVNISEV